MSSFQTFLYIVNFPIHKPRVLTVFLCQIPGLFLVKPIGMPTFGRHVKCEDRALYKAFMLSARRDALCCLPLARKQLTFMPGKHPPVHSTMLAALQRMVFTF
ncbi:hypothetical protein SDC9_141054 [bioreactor metagenome]|uniref:Uncharacterized protein n=1 Tax=bioreactor metagenome TaxID=1076179 RepID=A0A645E000_9ZZZZ